MGLGEFPAAGEWQELVSRDTLTSVDLHAVASEPPVIHFIYSFIYLSTYLFRLRWVFVAARAFSSCGELGLFLIAVRGLLIAVASLVAEHRL